MSRMRRHIAGEPPPDEECGARLCSKDGCGQPGEYPAPRSREHLREFLWFCLEHIRDYNRAWDYYAGMDTAEIERHIRADTTWNRPTWPLGSRAGPGYRGAGPEIHDAFGVFGDQGSDGEDRRGRMNGNGKVPREARAAFEVMGLTPPVTETEIRLRFRELVKRLHPDANGGDKQAEERLKSVTHAYATLKKSGHLK